MEPITIREYLAKKIEAQEHRRIKRIENQLKKVENQLETVENQLETVENQHKKEQETVILNLHAKGFVAETIADVLSKPLPFVLEVLEKNIDNQ